MTETEKTTEIATETQAIPLPPQEKASIPSQEEENGNNPTSAEISESDKKATPEKVNPDDKDTPKNQAEPEAPEAKEEENGDIKEGDVKPQAEPEGVKRGAPEGGEEERAKEVEGHEPPTKIMAVEGVNGEVKGKPVEGVVNGDVEVEKKRL